MCPNRLCLAPTPCPNIDADHSDYLALLRKLRQIPGVKKVFVRSGIRYDYMLCDDNDAFFRELVRYHISGQLKVAPEHCIDSVLDYMGKPHIGTYERFMDEYRQLNHRYDKEQYVVPYLMSSHPGSTLADAVALAEYLNRRGRQPEQVQDFYPTPGTISTCMYHTGIDPRTMQPVYVAKTPHEKDMQRALLQWRRPDKRRLVIQALHEAGREDLIGFGKDCLVRPMTDRRKPARPAEPQPPQRKYGKVYGGGKKPASARAAHGAFHSFLAELCVAWEKEARQIRQTRPARNVRQAGRAPLRRQGHAAPARERRPPMSYLFLYLAAINIIAFAAMGIDKAKARAGKWRIAEGTLFALAALGGALGGTLGMRMFHHKTKHKEFRFGFPALLCLQCAAVVYLILIWKQVI